MLPKQFQDYGEIARMGCYGYCDVGGYLQLYTIVTHFTNPHF